LTDAVSAYASQDFVVIHKYWF